MTRTLREGHRAVVAAREPEPPVDTDEITALVEATGHEVLAAITQPGTPDPGSYLGEGTLKELAAVVEDRNATLVVIDDGLTPGQHRSIEQAVPADTIVFDRHRLVLDVFARGAGSRRAQLQVELEQLRYDLPRIAEETDADRLNLLAEKGLPLYDLQDRIARLERELEELPDPTEHFRERRREEGFDLVTIAGYTNAGKSTLLHRIADELSCADMTPDRGDDSAKNATAAVEDRLFKTLETTTRRATIDGRPVLATDTVGLIEDLPHELVAAFSSTLSEAAAADVVVLVADASESTERFREKLELSLSVLEQQGVERSAIVTALNKVDAIGDDALAERLAIARERAPAPLPVSVLQDDNVDALLERVLERLPDAELAVELPNGDEAMALVSRAYDRTTVETVEYEGERVRLCCRGHPTVVERLRADALELECARELEAGGVSRHRSPR